MAAPTQTPKTAYDLTVGVIVNMDEAIYMLSPDDSPMITGLGADGLSVIATSTVDEIVFSFMNDSLLLPRSTLNGALTTGDTFLTVASGDRTKFSTGDSIKIGKAGGNDEIIRITGYGTTVDTLLITKGLVGTSTNYASGAIIMSTGTALPEGDDPEAARTVDRVENSNVTQIFGPTSVHLSATEQIVRKYGVSNEFAHQTFGRMKENVISREQALLYGRKFNSTTAKIRTTGGLAQYIVSGKDTTLTQLNVANISGVLQGTYNRGGLPDRVMANPIGFSDLNDLSNTSIVRVDIQDERRGRMRVMAVETEYGTLACVRNRWMLPSDAFFLKRENVIRRTMRPLVLERLAKTGDSDKAQIVCEEGLEVKGEGHMAWLSGLTYTGSV
jgi:hypothetical protein